MKLLNHLDFNKLEARNMVSSVLATAPSSPVLGQAYYDSVSLIELSWNGSAWTNKATDSLLLSGNNSAFFLSRTNHTGTQLAATISDLATTVQGYRLDQFTIPTTDINLNTHKIYNVVDPTNPQDAATKNYVDTQMQSTAAGIDAKASVRIASTGNLGLSGLAAIDGVTPVANDRILAKNQTTASQNGVYLAAAGAWTRALDADQNNEVTPGAFWYVEEGTANGVTQWRIQNTGAIVVGTTALTINQFGAGAIYTASNGILLSAGNFTAVAIASGGLSVVSGGIQVDTSIVARKFSATIGDGSTTTITVTHNLGTQDVIVSVRDASTNAVILADVVANATNTITVAFSAAPASNAYRVTVIG
jgi:hypothetical protein